MKISLTIAGSDSGGGAGLQADIKTMQSLGVYSTCVVTCTTAQNSEGISEIIKLPTTHIKNQLSKVLDDFKLESVKIGVIGDENNAQVISELLVKNKIKNIILDPVMACKNTTVFLEDSAIENIKKYLIPISELITPNIYEACILSGTNIKNIKTKKDIVSVYNKIKSLGCKNVLIKAGHLKEYSMDILFHNDNIYEFKNEIIKTKNTHGTGCTLSSSIAAYIALGNDLVKSVRLAKEYTYSCIEKGSGFKTKGPGPIGHHCKQHK